MVMAPQVNGLPAYTAPSLPPDQPVETGRYLDALRRSKLLILLIVLPLTAAVLIVSLMLPKTYRATSKVVVEGVSDPLQNRDVETIERRLATIDALITTRETLRRAARKVPGETAATLDESVSSSVDPAANIINISATAETPRRIRANRERGRDDVRQHGATHRAAPPRPGSRHAQPGPRGARGQAGRASSR